MYFATEHVQVKKKAKNDNHGEMKYNFQCSFFVHYMWIEELVITYNIKIKMYQH